MDWFRASAASFDLESESKEALEHNDYLLQEHFNSSDGKDFSKAFDVMSDYRGEPSLLNNTFEFPSFPVYIQVIYTSCCAITFLVGVTGNLLVPIVVYKDKELTTSSTGAFIVNLALSDLLVLLICNPVMIVELFSPPQVWVLPAALCKLVPFVEYLVELASIFTILAISLERHHVICHPLKAASACTRTKAAIICGLVWPIAATFSSPIIFWTEMTEAKYMNSSTAPVCIAEIGTLWPWVYSLCLNIGGFYVPLVILIALYWRIVRQLLLDDKYLCPQKSNCHLQARKQVVLMMGTVVISFFVCLLPFNVFSLWHYLASDIYIMNKDLYFNISYFARVMVYVNSAINPILYNLTSSRFRASLVRVLGIKSKRASLSRTSSFRPTHTLNVGVSLPILSNMCVSKNGTAECEGRNKNLLEVPAPHCSHHHLAYSMDVVSDNNLDWEDKVPSDKYTSSTVKFINPCYVNYGSSGHRRKKHCPVIFRRGIRIDANGSDSKSPFLGRSIYYKSASRMSKNTSYSKNGNNQRLYACENAEKSNNGFPSVLLKSKSVKTVYNTNESYV